MAEEPIVEEAPKKKKGSRLPIIIACALMLFTGGFFGLKFRMASGAKAPEVKLGEVLPLKEFLVNLADTKTYLRTEVALHLQDGIKKEDVDKSMPAILDAIGTILSSKNTKEIATTSGKEALKREIAEAVNKRLTIDSGKPAMKGDSKRHDDWDSPNGPVLKVYFTTFAFQ